MGIKAYANDRQYIPLSHTIYSQTLSHNRSYHNPRFTKVVFLKGNSFKPGE